MSGVPKIEIAESVEELKLSHEAAKISTIDLLKYKVCIFIMYYFNFSIS